MQSSGSAALPRPMNIDANADQLTMADCLHLTSMQQQLAGFEAATQAFLASLDRRVAISYNPNLDFYPGTSIAAIDLQDAVYCINYVMKRWRFVYNASLACGSDGAGRAAALVSVDLAGGKVGEHDQAEIYVEAPATGTVVTATVEISCGSGGSSSQSVVALGAAGAGGTTSPFTGAISPAAGCAVTLIGYDIQLTSTEGVFSIAMPWADSTSMDRRLRPWDAGPAAVECGAPGPGAGPSPPPPPSPLFPASPDTPPTPAVPPLPPPPPVPPSGPPPPQPSPEPNPPPPPSPGMPPMPPPNAPPPVMPMPSRPPPLPSPPSPPHTPPESPPLTPPVSPGPVHPPPLMPPPAEPPL